MAIHPTQVPFAWLVNMMGFVHLSACNWFIRLIVYVYTFFLIRFLLEEMDRKVPGYEGRAWGQSMRYPLWHLGTASVIQLAVMYWPGLPFPDSELPIPYALNFYCVLIALNNWDPERGLAAAGLRPNARIQHWPRLGDPYDSRG
jgi:hypothetical protein